MALASIGGALTAASGFLGLGARLHAPPRETDDEPDAFDPHVPAPEGLAPGAPCFEAVAQALAEAGYLDS